MSFSERWALRVGRVGEKFDRRFAGYVAETERSVRVGSEITNSPGQPVADENGGNLRASWIGEFLAKYEWQFTTDAPYARSNEDGIARPGGGPYVLRASTGGRHSIKLTRAGWPHIVAHVNAQQGGT